MSATTVQDFRVVIPAFLSLGVVTHKKIVRMDVMKRIAIVSVVCSVSMHFVTTVPNWYGCNIANIYTEWTIPLLN